MLPSNHLVLRHALLLPSIFPSIRVFSNELALCIRWRKYWSIIISPSSEYSGLISFRINSFDLLVVQGSLKSLLQHHNSRASILQCSVFFMVQLFATPWTTAPGFSVTVSNSLLKLMSIELMMPSNHLILCHPLLLLPSIFPSIRESAPFPMSQLFASAGQSIRT